MGWSRLQAARVQGWVTRAAGSWGTPGPAIRRPPSRPMHTYTSTQRMAIRPGEGTRTAVVPASGIVSITVGPEALNTWYVTYCSLQTSIGAADTSTCAVMVGPAGGGIWPAGQSYAGGGDSVSLGNAVLKPGEFVTATWSGATPGSTAILTVNGQQDILI